MNSKKGLVYGCLLIFTMSIGCNNPESVASNEPPSFYPIQPVLIKDVKLTDDFWLPIIEKVQKKTIQYALDKSAEEGRFENFLIAGGKRNGNARGAMPFDDTDVYKIIEGASNSLLSAPNPKLEKQLDSIIEIIKIGQEEDGYLTTWRTIDPSKPPATWVTVDEGKRWEHLESSHEMYNPGHLYEAAVVHYQATGKKNFLDIAIKNADLIVKTFGDEAGKIKAVPGHQIIETGLLKLYGVTGNLSYKKMARYLLDQRGNKNHHKLFNAYAQDHLPVVDQKEVVGHAVRAMYMYAAMTDIAAIDHDESYLGAVNALWENMVSKKMYLTGGIGARHDGEAFGDNYELPNLTAYNETCAAIGSVYWNHRLHKLTGKAEYFDVIERTLYNGLLSGLSLDGTQFFYPNALESDGVYRFNRGQCTRQDWFDCSCCPTNMIRFLPSLPNLLYSTSSESIYVNLYASNKAQLKMADTTIELLQKAQMPWNGVVSIRVNPSETTEFSIKLRTPYWSQNSVLPFDLYAFNTNIEEKIQLTLNGKTIPFQIEAGYITLKRKWKKGDLIALHFPMKARAVVTKSVVAENNGKIAIEKGPLVYAFEEIDNSLPLEQMEIPSEGPYKTQFQKKVLNGVEVLSVNNYKAIPYYSWSNRGIGKMKVWVNEQK
jgi:DUF1680 family protein